MYKALFILKALPFLIAAILFTTSPAYAEKSETEVELEKVRSKIVQLTQELNFLQQKAMTSIPELKAHKERYDKVIKDTIKEMGHDSDALEKRLKVISRRIGNKAVQLTAEEEKQLQKEFIEKRNTLTQSFVEATKKPEVQAASKEFSKALSKAVTSLNPAAANIEEEIQGLQKDYQELASKVAKQAKN